MQNIAELVRQLAADGVVVYLDDGTLKARTQASSLTSDQVSLIKTKKQELISYLSIATRKQKAAISKKDALSAPLSYQQQGLWFLDNRQGGSADYNMFAYFKLEGQFNISLAERSLTKIIGRHEVLRTRYEEVDGRLQQIVCNAYDYEIKRVSLCARDQVHCSEVVANYCNDVNQSVFDLRIHKMLDVRMLSCESADSASETHYLLFNICHIAADGWSMDVLIQQFLAEYESQEIDSAERAEESLQYTDYSLWQREWLEQGRGQQQTEYWQEQFEGVPANHSLKMLQHKASLNRADNIKIVRALSPRDSKRLFALADHFHVTPFMLQHALMALIICRNSGADEVVMGTSFANRGDSKLNDLVGLFANTVALRVNIRHDTLLEYLLHVSAVHTGAQENQDLPFELVVEAAGVERQHNSPLFQIMLINDTNFGLEGRANDQVINLGGARMVRQFDNELQARYELNVSLNIIEERVTVETVFNSQLFSFDFIEGLLDQYVMLVNNLLAVSDQLLQHEQCRLVDLHSYDSQTFKMLSHSNVENYVDDGELLHSAFERHAASQPEHICIVHNDQVITYQELNQWANRLAHYLDRFDIAPDDIVCVCMEKSIEVAVAELAILKVGAAFTPIDPDLPDERIEYFLEDTAAEVVLTSKTVMPQLPLDEQTVIPIDKAISDVLLSKCSEENYRSSVTSHNLAYVIYTSGSTGKPKGVMVEHRNIVNQNRCEIKDFEFDSSSRILHSISFSFDPAVAHLFAPLNAGSQVVIANSVDAVPTLLTEHRITHVSLPASVLSALDIEPYPDLKLVTAGAEKCSYEVARAWGKGRKFLFTYGPTETAVGATWGEFSKVSNSPVIGMPIDNVYCLVLDSQGIPVPPGIEGELFIGGAGVARGYLNDIEKTRARFVCHPYVDDPTVKLFKTGDLVKQLDDGNYEFICRLDSQVKLNGFRIELGEIESTLLGHDGIESCHLKLIEDSGRKYLCAYYIVEPTAKTTATESEIKKGLAEKLPKYMVPSHLVSLERWPLSLNGKIDHEKLPVPDIAPHQSTNVVQPVNEFEQSLLEIWSELLQVDESGLSVTESFFELGGDSILSIQMVSRALKAGMAITVNDVFEAENIRALALQAADPAMSNQVVQTATEGEMQVLPICHMFSKDRSDLHHFNQSASFDLPETISRTKLLSLLQALVTRHDALRLAFTWSQQQTIRAEFSEVSEHDIAACIIEHQSTTQDFSDLDEVIFKGQSSLKLETAPLMRAIYSENRDGDARLVLIFHHFVIDGVSWRIILSDIDLMLKSPIANGLLPLKTESYQRCGEQLTSYAASEAIQSEREYWQKTLDKNVSPIVSNNHKPGNNALQEHTKISLSADESQRLLRCGKAYNTQINELLLSALACSFAKVWPAGPYRIDLESHGRKFFSEQFDIHETVGWFSSVYPIILEPCCGEWAVTIRNIKNTVRSVPGDGIGYGILQHLLPATKSSQPLEGRVNSNLLFNYLGVLGESAEGAVAKLVDADFAGNVSPLRKLNHLISINSMIVQGQLVFDIGFDGSQVKVSEIEHLSICMQESLIDLIEHCEMQRVTRYSSIDFPLSELADIEFFELEEMCTNSGQRIQDIYPATAMQQGLLLQSQLRPGTYISQMVFTIATALDCERFKLGWQELIKGFPIFRTMFWQSSAGDFHQVICEDVPLSIIYKDLSSLGGQAQSSAMLEVTSSDRIKGFEFNKAPLMRLHIWKLSTSSFRVLWSHHHALIDGWCLPIVFDELSKVYSGAESASASSSAPSYRNYIEWYECRDKGADRKHWRNALSGLNSKTSFAKAVSDSDLRSTEQFNFKADFGVELSSKLKNICRQQRVTPNVLVQALIGFVLHRYSGDDQVTFGTTVSGRPPDLPDSERMLGLFINTIPTIIDFDVGKPISEWLRDQQQQHVAALSHSHLALVDILDEAPAVLKRDLFDILLVFENYPVGDGLLGDIGRRGLPIEDIQSYESSDYAMTLTVAFDTQLSIEVGAESSRYSQLMVEAFVGHIEIAAEQLCELEMSMSTDAIELVRADEREQLLIEFNSRHKAYSKDQLLHVRFEKQTKSTPDNTALIHNGDKYTYQQVNDQANKLAIVLAQYSVGRNKLIGVHMARSINFLISILAIMKTGSAYVPLENASPESRLEYMLEDSEVSVVLFDQSSAARASKHQSVHWLDVDLVVSSEAVAANLAVISQADDCAYMLYTSGSTGKPKGALVHHGGAVNHIDAEFDVLGFMDDQGELLPHNFLQSASISSDVSVWQFLAPVLSGGYAVIVDNMIDMQAMHSAMVEHQVHLVEMAPSVLREYLLYLEDAEVGDELALSLKWMMSIAEPISVGLVNQWLTLFPDIPIMNGYGPTEASDDVSEYIISEKLPESLSSVPIGKPLPNINMYVLSRGERLQPIGIPGEIAVSGICVGKGYWRNEEKTQKAFIENPYKNAHAHGDMLYKTGDLGYWNDAGEIILIGRTDSQVKVRGFRVELGEVESLISKVPGILDVAILHNKKSDGVGTLSAYLVKVRESDIDSNILYSELSNLMPDYMIPSNLNWLDKMPLNAADKIDRAALAVLDLPNQQRTEVSQAENDLETRLVTLWAELLDQPQELICVETPFFSMGGHSLGMVRMLGKIRSELGIDIGVQRLFEAQTIRKIAQAVDLIQLVDSSEVLAEGYEEMTL